MRAALLAALLASGCAAGREGGGTAGRGPRPDDPLPPPEAVLDADPARAMATEDLRVEADRIRVVLPPRLVGDLDRPAEEGPPWTFRVGAVVLVARELQPEVVVAGEDFTVEAEGIVNLRRRLGRLEWTEGPFRTVLLRNGRMMRR